MLSKPFKKSGWKTLTNASPRPPAHGARTVYTRASYTCAFVGPLIVIDSSNSFSWLRQNKRPACEHQAEQVHAQDLVGVCSDPTGGSICAHLLDNA